ncbi:MAG: GNAT family N-acetyltransferase [Anaerolineae bacterium]|nr:GNAT family N-acetyltransferase [Anaerolineae bacterium]
MNIPTACITIRPITEPDCAMIAAAFAAQGWHKPLAQYQRYLAETQRGEREVLLAEYDGQFAGYLTIVWHSHYPPFAQHHIPEIVDFNILLRYQRRKVGTALMNAAEHRIASLGHAIGGIGVGLHADYGAAQVLYVKRGYVPDGRGLFYRGRHVVYGEPVTVGDDLTLYFTKTL